jgi:hypothetical protein
VRSPLPVPAGGQAPVGLSVIPSPREMGGMECWDRLRWAGSIKRDDHAARGGDHEPNDPHPPLLRGRRLLTPPAGVAGLVGSRARM